LTGAPPLPHGALMSDTLLRLAATIAERRTADPATSWVAKLHSRGLGAIARKFGEEAVETVVAALDGSNQELTAEAADSLFHLMILLDARGVRIEDVLAELEQREGTSGITEKAGRAL
jgi:phosphoribosyl-ATP pyrophosphohydrolase